ncbi:hypothetical protein [Kushneria phosphatilytica]|uniref:Uncharacterized protein n=1 Tax=Kushneria phosphatilytica TaxID=657387 RepID=A0A1S1NWB9_9GAMM|nr:hypothetical protein [Kushneria phosphatilytica]OHV11860.1 hypothetical protein BH688_04010 [Kushneria phosphatilytica]QEL11034.1 hypothetical protein FY550_07770 [Kushneria phosphatilytica]
MLDMTCHRCGSNNIHVVEDAMDWDEVTCRECGEFLTTYGAAMALMQPVPLADACIKTQQLARCMGISLAG